MHTKLGFTLVESVISIGIFIVLITIVYQAAASITRDIRSYQQTSTLASLADEYLEVARNLPYSQVGTLSGNPHGNLYDEPNATTTTWNGTAYQIYYVVNYVDDPTDGTAVLGTDSAPNDYKQVKLYILNTATGVTSSFLTTIAPKGLENTANSGSLSIKVFNAVGQPVSNATIVITNSNVSPTIHLIRKSDASGNWVEVGLPDSTNGYHIVVSKSGYSSDQTYPITVSNPNPVKPDATIANQQTTQISFSIDQTSLLTFNTLDQNCKPLPTVGIEVVGSKLVGTSPDVVKFDSTYTSDTNGTLIVNPIEWDTYTPRLTSDNYMIYGSSPIQQINILPNTVQLFSLIVGPSTPDSLLVIVKDASTGNPLEGTTVDVHIVNPASDNYKITGGSIWGQEDWSGGSGQQDVTVSNMYAEDDGGIDVHEIPSGVRLAQVGSTYVSSGALTSSSFDTGTASSSYTTLNWQPTSQNASTTIAFQIATNDDDTTWNFVGPDGTADTYYTVPGTTISTSNNNNRYVRYKAYLSTTDPTQTPVLTSVSINYVSGCFTPGQVMYPGLSAGLNYTITASLPGYQSQTLNDVDVEGYYVTPISLSTS